MAKVEHSGWDATNWDLSAQQPHGGQEWSSLRNFVEDFSVTTNFLGPPSKAVAACGLALSHIEHYPAANCEPQLSELADFLQPNNVEELKTRLVLGNGASELIDLVTRCGAHEGKFAVRPTQYKEYERAALADGREKSNDGFSMLALVNPCNPTGEYQDVEAMKRHIEERCTDNTTVLVDESMQLWRGPNWREDSLVSQNEWITKMIAERDIRVYVIHSWTKIWSCPGLRIGSMICPTAELNCELKRHQVPWSVNVFALQFLSAAIKDSDFLKQTWAQVPELRARTIQEFSAAFPAWDFFGEPWLSWIWVDTKDPQVAAACVMAAKRAGVPLRTGAMGYEKPTFVRLKVAAIDKQDILLSALKAVA